jgi:hypothetical protein
MRSQLSRCMIKRGTDVDAERTQGATVPCECNIALGSSQKCYVLAYLKTSAQRACLMARTTCASRANRVSLLGGFCVTSAMARAAGEVKSTSHRICWKRRP